MYIKPVSCCFNSFNSKKLFKKHFNTCSYSGEKFEPKDTKTIEHIVPKSKGGTNDLSNYIVVKRSWNSKRSSVPLDEFIRQNPDVKENIVRTVNEHYGEIIDGIHWSEAVKLTLINAIGYDIFS